MLQESNFASKYLNGFSLFIIIAYLSASCVMEYCSPHILWEGIYISLPLICIFIYWSGTINHLITRTDSQLTQGDVFRRDFFLITYSFLLATIFSLLFQYDNSDVKGWWPFIMYLFTLYGLVFATLFSLIALMITNHKVYSVIFSLLIFFIFLFSKYWPHDFNVFYIGEVNSFAVIYFGLICVHLILCSSYKLYKFATNIIT